MNIYAIDDIRLALNALTAAIREAVPDAVIHAFHRPSELVAAIPSTPCDVAFLDIQMPGMTGMEIAKMLKNAYPSVNIIFVTGFNDHAVEAMELRASGYIMKPVTKEKVERELSALRNPVEKENDQRLYAQCFGNFEVFSKNGLLRFRRAKTKELFAYLIDRRGGSCTMGELMAVLWEDREDTDSLRTQLRTLISDLRMVLKEEGCESVIIKSRNAIAVDPDAIRCDYYNYLRAPLSNINLYRGEYMAQYSWAEATNASLMTE